MPTPPWHGHLLRGITEASRKHRDRRATFSNGVVLLLPSACCVPNRETEVVYSIQWFISQGVEIARQSCLNLLFVGKKLLAQVNHPEGN
jgi:hypothetical protein